MASPVGDPISELKSRRERARAGGDERHWKPFVPQDEALHETGLISP